MSLSVAPAAPVVAQPEEPPGETELQATWSQDQLVVWAAGRGTTPAGDDELSDRLEAVGAPPHGWSPHRSIPLPSGARAPALSIAMADALGWLVAVGAGPAGNGVGASVRWLGRVSLCAVNLVAQGRVVPMLALNRRQGGRSTAATVRWTPALIDAAEVNTLAQRMPGPVCALERAEPRTVVLTVMESVVDAILRQAATRVDLPAAPPQVRNAGDLSAAVLARLDGSSFPAPVAPSTSLARRVTAWSKPVAGVARTKLIVQLDEPDGLAQDLGPGELGLRLPFGQRGGGLGQVGAVELHPFAARLHERPGLGRQLGDLRPRELHVVEYHRPLHVAQLGRANHGLVFGRRPQAQRRCRLAP